MILVPAVAVAQAPITTYDPAVNATIIKSETTLSNNVNSSGKAVVLAINNSANQITSIMQVLNDYQEHDRKLIFNAEQKRANAERYSSNNGSRAKVSCGIYKYAAVKSYGNQMVERIMSDSNQLSLNHFESERGSSPDELTLSASAGRVINTIAALRDFEESTQPPNIKIKEGVLVSSGNESLSTVPLESGHSQYTLTVRKNNILVDTFPERLPDNYDHAGQSNSEVLANASAVARIEKLKVAMEQLNYIAAERAAVMPKDWIDYFFEKNTSLGSDMKERYFGESEYMGKAAVRSALNNMRINDTDWIGRVGSSTDNQMSLMKDQSFMLAQALENDQKLIDLNTRLLQVISLMYSEMVNANTEDNIQMTN